MTCPRSPAGDGAARSALVPGAHRPKGTTSRGKPGPALEPPMNEKQQVSGSGHLWAIGYDDMERADQVRDEITRLGWDEPYLLLSDVAVVSTPRHGAFHGEGGALPALHNH